MPVSSYGNECFKNEPYLKFSYNVTLPPAEADGWQPFSDWVDNSLVNSLMLITCVLTIHILIRWKFHFPHSTEENKNLKLHCVCVNMESYSVFNLLISFFFLPRKRNDGSKQHIICKKPVGKFVKMSKLPWSKQIKRWVSRCSVGCWLPLSCPNWIFEKNGSQVPPSSTY